MSEMGIKFGRQFRFPCPQQNLTTFESYQKKVLSNSVLLGQFGLVADVEHPICSDIDLFMITSPHSQVYFCSDKSQDLFLNGCHMFNTTDVQIGRCGSTSDVRRILVSSLNTNATNNELQIYIDFKTIPQTLDALYFVSQFYIPEDKFRNTLSFFISWPSNNNSEFQKTLRQVSLLFPRSSQVYMYLKLKEEDASCRWMPKLWEVYSIGGKVFMNEIKLNSELGPGPRVAYPSKPLRSNLENTVIRAIAFDSDDEQFFVAFQRNGSELTFRSGFSVHVLQDLGDSLNFKIKAIAGQSFITDINETVGGMGAQLLSNEADIIISLSYILPYRIKYISPSVHIHRDRIMVFFRQPRQNTHKNMFLNPFNSNTWTALVTAWILILCSASLMNWVQKKCRLKYLSDSYTWILGAISQKSSHFPPSLCSQRILFLIVFLMSLVMYAFYAASIISRLTVNNGGLDSLKDLFASNFHFLSNPIYHYSHYLEKTFLSSKTDTHSHEDLFIDDHDSLEKALRGGVGFMSSLDTVVIAARDLNISEQSLCNSISSVPLDGLVLPLAFYFRPGSPLKEPFNVKLLNLMNRGLIHRYMNDYVWNTSPLCLTAETNSIEIIQFSDVSSAFFGLSLAVLVSALIMVAEIVCKFKSHKQPAGILAQRQQYLE